MHTVKKVILIPLILVLGQSFGQLPASLGLQLHYNYAIQSIGAGFRFEIPISSSISIVPQVKYQPAGLNTIHEVYAGLAFSYNILMTSASKFYLIGAVDANSWFNYIPSATTKAQRFNILPKPGAGLEFGFGSLAVFGELKYNVLWNESYTDFGVKIRRNDAKRRRKDPQLDCPKIL